MDKTIMPTVPANHGPAEEVLGNPGGYQEAAGPKSSLARSVVANWAGHLVFILGGFILPRLISDHLGQERLGVWDFGWSTVAYFNLLSAGIASSVNRYVAKFRASSQWDDMSEAVSCCTFFFAGSAVTGVGVTIVLVFALPWISPPAFLPYLAEMRALLLFLGLSVSIDLFLPSYVGVISGSQRYDLLALIEAGCYLVLIGWIVLILLLGANLSWLGASILCMRSVEGILKGLTARSLCPKLRLSPSLVTRQGLKTVFAFGGKTLMETVAKIGLYQGNNMLIAYLLGPSSLAVYARSMSLILHANKLLFHFGRVFAPSASHLKVDGDIRSLRGLILNGAQTGAFIALPLALVFGILGGSLLRLWMGPGYAELAVLPILAVGHFFAHFQVGTFYALMGMNQHGRASLTVLGFSIMSLVGTFLLIKYSQLGLFGVGLSTGLAVAIPYLTVIPRLVAATVDVPPLRYLRETLQTPILLCLPFAFCLVGARQWGGPNDFQILGCGLGIGGLILFPIYWRWVVPVVMKGKIKGLILR